MTSTSTMTFCNTFYSLLGAPRPFDPTHKYTTSYLISPLALALIRLLFSLYAFVAIFFQLAYESTVSDPDQRWTARHSLSYFTNLCYWGLAFYYLFSGLHTLAYRFDTRASTGEEETWGNGKDVANGGHLPPARRSFWGYLNLNNWPRPLQALHTIFYSSVMTFSPLVTIVFWAVLYRGPWWPDDFDQWKNVRLIPPSPPSYVKCRLNESDLRPRSEHPPSPFDHPLHQHAPFTAITPPRPHHPTCALPRARLPHPHRRWVLPILLPQPGRPLPGHRGRLHHRDPGGRVYHLWARLGCHVGEAKDSGEECEEENYWQRSRCRCRSGTGDHGKTECKFLKREGKILCLRVHKDRVTLHRLDFTRVKWEGAISYTPGSHFSEAHYQGRISKYR